MPIKELKAIVVKINNHKTKIAKERDALRRIFIDLEDEIQSFDEGIDGIDDGIRSIEDAIDSISEVV